MKRQLLTIGATGAIIAAAAACGPAPVIPPPAFCGQTLDGKAVVMLAADVDRCSGPAGAKRIIVAELCGPLMPGSNVVDDCYRGNVPGKPSPDNFRFGTIQNTPGGMVLNFVASDATAT